mmetsp:Transcript_31209/g.89553  ORF Transcript_31209/g.89553 Transcript_31209/m.89553 type:complete len:331 (-) Transcript_31209:92-1084(-)
MEAAGPGFPGPDGWTILFVYGTLKRGFTNHARYLAFSEAKKKAAFLGSATTEEKYPMVIRPPHVKPTTCAPVLIDKAGSGHCVHGEVYKVDADTLAALDILEGVRSGFYYKKAIQVVLAESAPGSSGSLGCQAYFFPETEELMALPPHPSYLQEHHALYQPAPINREIAELCQGRGSHGLACPQPCATSALCLRLLPGDDILKCLKAFAEERELDAAVVLTCVGSTGQTTLRPAGVPKPKVFEGKFEIVSMTGTLSRAGHHLHMSISDPECNVFGGHMMEGCIVRTTAEIALSVLEGLEFTRPLDARTGYDELSIAELPPEKRRRANGHE